MQTDRQTDSHTPNLEMLSHLKILINYHPASIRATLFAYNVNIYHAVTGDILHDLNSDYYYTKY